MNKIQALRRWTEHSREPKPVQHRNVVIARMAPPLGTDSWKQITYVIMRERRKVYAWGAPKIEKWMDKQALCTPSWTAKETTGNVPCKPSAASNYTLSFVPSPVLDFECYCTIDDEGQHSSVFPFLSAETDPTLRGFIKKASCVVPWHRTATSPCALKHFCKLYPYL